MTLYLCACSNVKIYPTEILDKSQVVVSPLEENDLFFKQDLTCASVDIGSIKVEQSFLVQSSNVGQWITHQCLNCMTQTHAMSREKGLGCTLIVTRLGGDVSQLNALKSKEGYSALFKIVLGVPAEKEEQMHAIESLKESKLLPTVQAASRAINLQLTQYIQEEERRMEERIRIYKEQQHNAFLQLQDRARSDRQLLVRMLMSLDKQDIRPAEVESVKTTGGVAGVSQLSRLVQRDTRVPPVVNRTARRPIGMAYSLDTEGLFDMEAPDADQNNFQSDEEQDTDDSGSHDEGIHIPRTRPRVDIAQSLPVTVPGYNDPGSDEILPLDDPDFDETDFDNPQDIAASMQALAQSVHGGNLFGDLPRPRLNTLH